MPSPADRRVKQQRLARVRSEAGADALVLTSHEAVSWYLDGVRTHVSLAGPPVLAVRVDDEGDRLFVAANEAERLADEELLPDDTARIERVPWQTPPADAAAAVGPAATEAALAGALRAARASLLPGERDRYRVLGRQAAEAMTDAAATLSPHSSERRAASVLAAALIERGIDPLVILVAGRSRLAHHHPLPTDAPLGDRAMLVVCGRRHGLIANATRWVGAAGPDDERILAVEADFLAATRPGTTLADAFARGCAAYGAHGFDADEWTRHHQGGPTGYAGRDPRATAHTLDPIVAGQAFAWNPSAPGAKVEDTVLIADDGVEVLTADPRWPTVTQAGRQRPAPLPFA